MEPATVLIIAITVVVIAITGFAIYTSFGPPSVELSDPFEDHEDWWIGNRYMIIPVSQVCY